MVDKFKEKKEGKLISDLMKEMELEHSRFLVVNCGKQFLHSKNIELADLKLTLGNMKFLSNDLIGKIRELTISQGGLLNSDYRRFFWRKLFGVLNDRYTYGNDVHLIQIYCKEDPNDAELNEKLSKKRKLQFLEKREKLANLNTNLNQTKHNDIIERDVNRTAFTHFSYFKPEEDLVNNEYFKIVKSNLKVWTKKLFCLKGMNYDYYQGFHDLSLYVYLLYVETPLLGFLMLQRISEFYLKDLLWNGDLNLNNQSIFETVTLLLSEVLNSIEEGKEAYEFLEKEFGNSYASLLVSNIVCLYTQKIKNVNICYRVLDYLLCSHPIAAYYLTAQIIIEEYNKYILSSNIEQEKSFLEHICSINYDKLNFDALIHSTEKAVKKVNISEIINKYSNRLIKSSPLLNNKNTLISEFHTHMKRREESKILDLSFSPFQYGKIMLIVSAILLAFSVYILKLNYSSNNYEIK